MSQSYQLIHGDCLEEMSKLSDCSIDMICADLPFGVTECLWDIALSYDKLWQHYQRLIKPRGAIVLNASQPFTTILIASSPLFGKKGQWFKYEWIWVKNSPTDIFNAKNKPMKRHENILVFSPGTVANRSEILMTYNPIGLRKKNEIKKAGNTRVFGDRPSRQSGDKYNQEFTNYPDSILEIDDLPKGNKLHSSQKPIDLLLYLIQTYTNENEVILDNTMGSGTTGEACIRLGRQFIGIEKYPINGPISEDNPNFFNIAEKRLDDTVLEIGKNWKQLIDNGSRINDLPMFAEL